jgi:uncharacterized protein (DUF1800 family)
MDETLRALNRFGLGARPGDRRRIGDPRAWLRQQLNGGPPRLAAPDGASPEAIGEAVRGFRALVRGADDERRRARQRIVAIGAAEVRAALTSRVTTDRPFVERLVAFWSNHLCVSIGAKVLVAPLAGAYEREAIRPHVLGRFEDLVLASATHPAMLVYLDNFQSIGPASRGARLGGRGGASGAAGQRRGLNENYARELLELHTLGVDGGYGQQDVQELARILTGWTVEGFGVARQAQAQASPARGRIGRRLRAARLPAADGPMAFAFVDLLHEPGPKTVLGTRYAEDGMDEGRRAIRALCRHQSTARFIARKLVTHFVADDPPQPAVDRIAAVFRSTEGDLKAVSQALVELPEAWRDEPRKFRAPQDWLVAALRALGATEVRENTAALLRQLRQPLWSPQAPKGFGDTMPEWADPDSLLNRGELARTLTRLPAFRAVDPGALADVVDLPAGNPLHGLLADASIPAPERLALALAGPAFQWR